MTPARLSRRSLLGLGLGLPLLGCGERSQVSDDPDVRLLDEVRADVGQLLGDYRAVMRHQRGLRADIAPLAAHLVEQLDVLGAKGRPPPPPASGRRAGAVSDLTRVVRQAQRRRQRQALAADSGDFARLLAAIAASHAQHVAILTGLGGQP